MSWNLNHGIRAILTLTFALEGWPVLSQGFPHYLDRNRQGLGSSIDTLPSPRHHRDEMDHQIWTLSEEDCVCGRGTLVTVHTVQLALN